MMKKVVWLLAFAIVASCKSEDPQPPPPFIARKVMVSQVVITELPATNTSGGGWDSGLSGPDVFFRITDSNNTEVFKSTVVDDVTTAKMPITVLIAYTITDFSKPFTFSAWDYDPIPPDQLMGGYNITMKDLFSPTATKFTEYPTSVKAETGIVKMTLSLIWSE